MKIPPRLSQILWHNLQTTLGVYPVMRREAMPVQKPRSRKTVIASVVIVGSFIMASGGIVFIICPGLPLLMVAALLFRNATLAPRISGAIAREQEQQRYDLASLTAIGRIGVSWLVASTLVKITLKLLPQAGKDQTSRSPRWVIRAVTFIGILVVLYALGNIVVDTVGYPSALAELLVDALNAVVITAAIVCDLDQAPTISALVGMLVPSYVRTPLEAQITAIVFYLAAHVGTYLTALVLALVAIPLLYAQVMPEQWIAYALLPILQFAVFYGIREGTVWLLWRWLCKRLQATRAELDFAMWLRL